MLLVTPISSISSAILLSFGMFSFFYVFRIPFHKLLINFLCLFNHLLSLLYVLFYFMNLV